MVVRSFLAWSPLQWLLLCGVVASLLLAQVALCEPAAAEHDQQHFAAGAVRLEPWGANSIRVRVAAPGLTAVGEPPISALLDAPPAVLEGSSTKAKAVSGGVKWTTESTNDARGEHSVRRTPVCSTRAFVCSLVDHKHPY